MAGLISRFFIYLFFFRNFSRSIHAYLFLLFVDHICGECCQEKSQIKTMKHKGENKRKDVVHSFKLPELHPYMLCGFNTQLAALLLVEFRL